jgi:hypothetical protein
MPKIEIIEDVLAPSDTLRIRFEGKNPFVAVTMARDLIRAVMKISSKDILETEVRWDLSGKIPGFFGKWMGRRTEDRWSRTNLRILVQGEQNSQDKTGWVMVQLKGTLVTTFEYSNFIQRSFWWFYNYTFYHKQRQKYLEFDKDNMYEMRERIKTAFGLEE